MTGPLPRFLLARGFGLTTWPAAKVRSLAISKSETSSFLGVLRASRLGKTPDAIQGQTGLPIRRRESKPQGDWLSFEVVRCREADSGIISLKLGLIREGHQRMIWCTRATGEKGRGRRY
jgi:hypothetical protein